MNEGKTCPNCGYQRTTDERSRPHRCPRCNEPYMLSLAARAVIARKREYRPNEVPLSDRLGYSLMAVLLVAIGFWGVIGDGIGIGVRGAGTKFRLDGFSAWLALGALVSFGLAVASVVIDHYDRRDNEWAYHAFIKWAVGVGIVLYLLALTWRAASAGA